MLRTKLHGVANPGVAKALGHGYRSLPSGVTDRYIGGVETAINALVAKDPKVNRFGPPVGDEGYMRQNIPTAKINEVCIENGFDQTIRANRKKAAAMIEEERQAQWTEEQQDVLSRETPKDDICLRKRKSLNMPTKLLAEKSPNVCPPKLQKTRTTLAAIAACLKVAWTPSKTRLDPPLPERDCIPLYQMISMICSCADLT